MDPEEGGKEAHTATGSLGGREAAQARECCSGLQAGSLAGKAGPHTTGVKHSKKLKTFPSTQSLLYPIYIPV